MSNDLNDSAALPAVERTKPTLLTVGNRQISSDGKWHDHLIADYVLDYAYNQWIPIGKLAAVSYGQNIPSNKLRVRRNLSSLFRYLLAKHAAWMVIEYNDKRGRAEKVKLLDPGREEDRQSAILKLKKMQQRKDMTTTDFDRAVKLFTVINSCQ